MIKRLSIKYSGMTDIKERMNEVIDWINRFDKQRAKAYKILAEEDKRFKDELIEIQKELNNVNPEKVKKVKRKAR